MMSRHPNGRGVDSSVVLPPHGNDEEGGRVVMSGRKPRSHRYLMNSTFGVIASVAAIAMLTYMCGFTKIRLGHRHTGDRSLSADRNLSDSDDSDECSGFFDWGAALSREPPDVGSPTGLPLRSAVLPPVDTDASVGFTGSEASGRGWSHSGSEASGSSSSRKRKHAASTSSAAPEYEKRHPKKRWLLWASGELPPDIRPQTASATEDESQPSTSAAALRYQGFPRGVGTALEQAGEGSVEGGRQYLHECMHHADTQQQAMSAEEVRAADGLLLMAGKSLESSQSGSSSSEEPSTSHATRSQTAVATFLENSYIFRLPALQSDGSGSVARLDWRKALDSHASHYSATSCLKALLKTFKERSICTTLGSSMVRWAENLISHMVTSERQQLSGLFPVFAVERLGRRFVVLEALICTLEVLGEPREQHWNEFVSKVPLNYEEHQGAKISLESANFNRALLARLKEAFKDIKKGKLPPSNLRKELHELLFFDCQGSKRLSRSAWNPWRG